MLAVCHTTVLGLGQKRVCGCCWLHTKCPVQVARLAVAHTFAEAGICQDFLSRVMDEFVIDPPNWRQRCVRTAVT
jgi:hypothetical protein